MDIDFDSYGADVQFPTNEILGLSPSASPEVYELSMISYNLGRMAHRSGKLRRRPSYKSEVADREAWLTGWDASAAESIHPPRFWH